MPGLLDFCMYSVAASRIALDFSIARHLRKQDYFCGMVLPRYLAHASRIMTQPPDARGRDVSTPPTPFDHTLPNWRKAYIGLGREDGRGLAV